MDKTIDWFFYGQHAADEKFNFEHLARSTVMNQQPLLQWVALWSQDSISLFSLSQVSMLMRNSWTSCSITCPYYSCYSYLFTLSPTTRPLTLELSAEEEVTILTHMDVIRWKITVIHLASCSYLQHWVIFFHCFLGRTALFLMRIRVLLQEDT